MEYREKVIKALEESIDANQNIGLSTVNMSFEAVEVLIELLKEQEEREKAICKEICDFIRGACSTDTDDDKDFVCYEIQRCFTHFGR